jgi:hypothetical protein
MRFARPAGRWAGPGPETAQAAALAGGARHAGWWERAGFGLSGCRGLGAHNREPGAGPAFLETQCRAPPVALDPSGPVDINEARKRRTEVLQQRARIARTRPACRTGDFGSGRAVHALAAETP